MKMKDVKRLANGLLPSLPGWSLRGRMLVREPLSGVLRAVYFDESAFDSTFFFAQAFIQPLFVPASHLTFNLGWRLGGPAYRWDLRAEDLVPRLSESISRKALPLFAQAESPRGIVNVAESLKKSADAYVQQAIAYAWAREGDVASASGAIDQLLLLLDDSVAWQREMAQRARALRQKLLEDVGGAQKQLDVWETETSAKLGLRTSDYIPIWSLGSLAPALRCG
jgi:hypothetical protein